MKLFGKKSYFALGYELDFDQNKWIAYDFNSFYEQTVGHLALYVDGYNLCEFKVDSDESVYSYHEPLYWPLAWLCRSLKKIMGFDLHPLPVEGENAYQKATNVLREGFPLADASILEWNLWDDSDWKRNHSWALDCSGMPLPTVYFYRVADNIEISWGSDFQTQYSFLSPAGCKEVSRTVFASVVLAFLTDFMKSISKKPVRKEELDSTLTEWKKEISVFDNYYGYDQEVIPSS